MDQLLHNASFFTDMTYILYKYGKGSSLKVSFKSLIYQKLNKQTI